MAPLASASTRSRCRFAACALFVLAAASSLAPARARAQDAGTQETSTQEADSQSREEQLGRELALHASDGRRARLVRGSTGLVIASIALPVGIVLKHRDEDLVRLTGVGLIVAGATELLPALSILFPTDMEGIYAHYRRRKAAGLSPDEIVEQTEREWRVRAQKERRTRTISGSVHLGLGVALLPVGLAFIARPHVGNLSSLTQLNTGSALLGVGLSFTALGLDLILNKGDSQRAWDQHLATHPRVARLPRFGAGPLPHGGALTAVGVF